MKILKKMIRSISINFLTLLILYITCAPLPKDFHKFPRDLDVSVEIDTTAHLPGKKSMNISPIVKAIEPHILTALVFYELGDWQKANDEFQLAFTFIEKISIRSIEGKLLFIENFISLPDYYQHLKIDKVYREIASAIDASERLDKDLKDSTSETGLPASELKLLDSIKYPSPSTEYRSLIETELRKLALKFGEENNLELPEDFIKEVEEHILTFQTSKREFFERTIRRSRKYFPLIKPIFDEKEIPEELIYMATVESGFSPTARSRANALGLWQLMPRTAKYYGLQVNHIKDERYDPIKSTYAAREYLLDLLTIFGSHSFMLAMASYNAGEGNVQAALKKMSSYKDRSFWKLRRAGFLHEDTNNFVPQILAAIIMSTNLSKFGFQEVSFINQALYTVIKVPFKTTLRTIAEAASIEQEMILRLNPDLEPDASSTPERVLNYPLFVPGDKAEIVEKRLNALHAAQLQKMAKRTSSNSIKNIGKEITDVLAYEVQRGNTLSELSNWFNTSIPKLKKWNSYLTERQMRVGDTVHIYELDRGWRKIIHIVKSGESLSSISKQYNIPIKYIQAWNGLNRSTIYSAQKLIIYKKYADLKRASKLKSNRGIIEKQFISKGEPFLYQVVEGNTLSDIAELFNVSVDKIEKWNELDLFHNQLSVGMKLTLYAPNDVTFIRYVIQKGDNLIKLSKEFGVSVSTLKKINSIQNSQLYAGDELRIFTF